MQEIYEVELRYRLEGAGVDSDLLAERLLSHGFVQTKSISQEDIYYSSKHKDFLKSEECLRVRTENGSSEITWKPPSTEYMKAADEFWKEEVDLQIDGQRDIARRLLVALDFFEVATVEKHRVSYIGRDNIEISLDMVSGLGSFVELEVKHVDPDIGIKLIREAASFLGLFDNEICRTPYRDLIRAKNGI